MKAWRREQRCAASRLGAPGRLVLLVGAILLAAGLCRGAAPDASGAGADLLPAVEPENLLTAGEAAFEDKLFSLAETRLRQCLERTRVSREEKLEALSFLVRTLHAQAKYREAAELLELKARWAKDLQNAEDTSYWRALTQYRLEKPEQALAELAGLEDKTSDPRRLARARRLSARSKLKLGRTEEAIKAFADFDAEYGKSDPEAPDNLLDWALALAGTNRLAEARDVLSVLVQRDPQVEAVRKGHHWLARLLSEEGKRQEAADVLRKLAESEIDADSRAEACFALSSVYSAAGATNDSIAALSNGLLVAVSPALKEQGNMEMGMRLVESGRLDDGIPLLKAFVSACPTDPKASDAQLTIGWAWLDNGRHEEAITEFRRYLETFTNSAGQARANEGMGWALSGAGRHAEAATAFLKAYELHTDAARKAECLFKNGDACFANGQYLLATNAYARVASEYPNTPLAHRALFQVAECLVKMEKLVEAERKFVEVAEAGPDQALAVESMLRAGETRSRLGEKLEVGGAWVQATRTFDQAVAAFDRVLAASNRTFMAQALLGRGMAQYRLFRMQPALDDFGSVVREFPDSAEQAFYMRGMCCYRMARDKEALDAWNEFVRKYPESKWAPSVLFEIAKYRFNGRDYQAAETNFCEIAEKYPGSDLADNAIFRAGQSAARRSDHARANELLVTLAKRYPKSEKLAEARLEQGNALRQLDRYSEAILAFDEIIRGQAGAPLVSQAWLGKGDCQFMMGREDRKRYDEAIASYRAVVETPGVEPDISMEADYKIGKCLQETGDEANAVAQYHSRVIVRFLDARKQGLWLNSACEKAFANAAFSAADIEESRKEWDKAIGLLERVAESGTDAAEQARQRIKKIKSENWRLFGY